jgi:hypothetical protein
MCRKLEKGRAKLICTSWPELHSRRALRGREWQLALTLQRLGGCVQIGHNG